MSSVPSQQRRQALRLLGLQDPVGPPEIVSAYRHLARQHHPDLGGNPDVFRALTMARDTLLTDPRSDADDNVRSSVRRRVVVRQRPGRRLLRRFRRRLGRKGGERRDLD